MVEWRRIVLYSSIQPGTARRARCRWRSAGRGATRTSASSFLPDRAWKAPTLRDSVGRLAERARAESWTHKEYLVACLQREVAARDAHGGEGRIRSARFPARKGLEEFDVDHARGLARDLIAHLGTFDFVTARQNVVFLGPPGTGKTHLAIGLGIRACQANHRDLFATASGWVARLADAHHAGCSSSTRPATSPSNQKPPTCSCSSSRPATNAPA
jgi:hypothetical protein